MAVRKPLGQAAVLSCSLALTVLAGCQNAAPVSQAPETTVNKGTQTTSQVQVPSSDTKNNPGTNPIAADPNQGVDNSNDGALDKATAMHIEAAKGGQYKSDDGLLTATFPPGSLSKDTDVKLVRVDTGALKNSDVFLNGIRYQWDLGDAYIMPGTKVTITSKADDRLVPALKNMYTDFTMERYSLSKDDNGNYAVTMSYKGTVEAQPPLTAQGAESVNRGTMQEGSFPVTGKSGEFKGDSRIEAFCNYAPPPLRAHYGNFDACVTWSSDSASGLDGKPAYEPGTGSTSPGDDRVYVVFSTSFVNAPLPPEYKIKDTIPAVPARPAVDTDQYGNIVANADGVTPPADYKDIVAKANDQRARGQGTYSGFAGYLDFSGTARLWDGQAQWQGPGQPGHDDAQFGKPVIKSQLLPAIAAQAAQEIVDESNVAIPASDGGHYVTGGHPFNGYCNCGSYVTQDDGPVISDTNVFTDASGKAHTTALQSYNSTNCSAGICAGGQVNFTVNAQAHTRYPDKASNSDAVIGLYGLPNSQDTAAGSCLALQAPKNSPYIRLNLTDSKAAPYSGTLVMEYELNGVAHTMTWSVGNTTGTVTEKFFMPNMTDDNDWSLKIKRIYTQDQSMTGNPVDVLKYEDFKLRRNNLYSLTVDMLLNEAK